jgi:hypothetical protein
MKKLWLLLAMAIPLQFIHAQEVKHAPTVEELTPPVIIGVLIWAFIDTRRYWKRNRRRQQIPGPIIWSCPYCGCVHLTKDCIDVLLGQRTKCRQCGVSFTRIECRQGRKRFIIEGPPDVS